MEIDNLKQYWDTLFDGISMLVMFGKVHVGIKLLIQDMNGWGGAHCFGLRLQSAVTPVRPEHRYILSVVGHMRS